MVSVLDRVARFGPWKKSLYFVLAQEASLVHRGEGGGEGGA